jgi:hypothetical protein
VSRPSPPVGLTFNSIIAPSLANTLLTSGLQCLIFDCIDFRSLARERGEEVPVSRPSPPQLVRPSTASSPAACSK